ncbi:MAG: hypothetical protein EOO85_28115, partial [Pedobacter sp.]
MSVLLTTGKSSAQDFAFKFYGKTFNIGLDNNFNIPFNDSISQLSITKFYDRLNKGNYQAIINTLVEY